VAASTGTFEPLLDNYIDVTKLLITVAAASIAFGGGRVPHPCRVLCDRVGAPFSTPLSS
jgi:hypothetical protein